MSFRLAGASTTFALLTILTLAPSCGGGAGGDQTTKFVGTWTFSSGALTPKCALISTPFSLKGLSVMFAKVDNSTISLGISAACVVKFNVSGDQATVEPKQTCTLDLGPPLGAETVAIDTWALTLSGDSIDNTIVGSVAGLCTASGTAVLTRGGADGGTHHADGGDAATGASEGGATEAGGDTSAAEAGADTSAADAAVDTSVADASAEAGD